MSRAQTKSQDDALLTLSEALAEDPVSGGTLLWTATPISARAAAGDAVFSWDRRAVGVGGVTGLVPPDDIGFDRLCVRVPGARAAQDWMVSQAAAMLSPGAALWLAGGQREGIKPLVKRLGKLGFGMTEVRRIKRRTRVVVARRDDSPRQAPALDAMEERFEAQVGNHTATCVTLPGVFAHGRLDPGTKLLIGVLVAQRPKAGRTVDLGCGCGVLSAAVALARPKAQVTAVDLNAVAVEAARRTVTANGLQDRIDVRHLTAEEASQTLGARHDLVVTNAPFHDGHDTDRGLMTEFAQAARQLLRPGGRLLLVSNHHLPYGPLLSDIFGKVERAAGDGRYVVYSCS